MRRGSRRCVVLVDVWFSSMRNGTARRQSEQHRSRSGVPTHERSQKGPLLTTDGVGSFNIDREKG